ncbi:HTH-type transcriptional repressor YvoA [compost metagenome]
MSRHSLSSVVVLSDSDEPIYVQIREQLRVLIMSGRLADGEMLPSLRELTGQLDCSLITVRRVYSDLEQAGLLIARKGIGTFVNYESSKVNRELGNMQFCLALKEAVHIGKMYQFSSDEMSRMLHQLLN